MAQDDCDNRELFDAYSPKEMACKARKIGVAKANLGFWTTFMLAVLAGGFIALGACFSTTAVAGFQGAYGVGRMIAGLAFALGLILVVVAGAELFTGNVLIVVAFLSRQVSLWKLLRNWAIVYFGNLVGSLGVVLLVYYAWQWKSGDMSVGITAFNLAGKKLGLPFATAFCSGVLCNALVCLAVWLCYSARSTTDKILSIVFPITAFVALGFEHSVANMYFIPYGMVLARTNEFLTGAGVLDALKCQPSLFTTSNFIVKNLIPVTLGNIVGGAILVGAVYWIIYLRHDHKNLEPLDTLDSDAELAEAETKTR